MPHIEPAHFVNLGIDFLPHMLIEAREAGLKENEPFAWFLGPGGPDIRIFHRFGHFGTFPGTLPPILAHFPSSRRRIKFDLPTPLYTSPFSSSDPKNADIFSSAFGYKPPNITKDWTRFLELPDCAKVSFPDLLESDFDPSYTLDLPRAVKYFNEEEKPKKSSASGEAAGDDEESDEDPASAPAADNAMDVDQPASPAKGQQAKTMGSKTPAKRKSGKKSRASRRQFAAVPEGEHLSNHELIKRSMPSTRATRPVDDDGLPLSDVHSFLTSNPGQVVRVSSFSSSTPFLVFDFVQ